jgi:hypothetical protein
VNSCWRADEVRSQLCNARPDGTYKIGVACSQGGAPDIGQYSETPITISNVTSAGFEYTFGATPTAPILTSPLTPGFQSVSGAFIRRLPPRRRPGTPSPLPRVQVPSSPLRQSPDPRCSA